MAIIKYICHFRSQLRFQPLHLSSVLFIQYFLAFIQYFLAIDYYEIKVILKYMEFLLIFN